MISGRLGRRVLVFVRRGRLDRELAEGVDPGSDRVLALRAGQLCTARARCSVARRLRRRLRGVERASVLQTRFLGLPGAEILAESEALIELVERLERRGTVEPMGVALARMLVTDPLSPLAVASEPGSLYTVVRLATLAMGSPRP